MPGQRLQGLQAWSQGAYQVPCQGPRGVPSVRIRAECALRKTDSGRGLVRALGELPRGTGWWPVPDRSAHIPGQVQTQLAFKLLFSLPQLPSSAQQNLSDLQ